MMKAIKFKDAWLGIKRAKVLPCHLSLVIDMINSVILSEVKGFLPSSLNLINFFVGIYKLIAKQIPMMVKVKLRFL